jgi:hypothetical protein
MDRRRNPRVTALLPVCVWGMDAHALPFMQAATVRNISSGGAVIQGLCRQIRPGEILEVQFGDEKAQFRVVWTGALGSRREGQIGLERLVSEPCIWDLNLCHCSQLMAEG